MGTRSKTSFIEKKGDKLTHLVSVYQQYDGYIEGVGHEIAEYILSKQICNGIRLGRDTSKLANGFGCLTQDDIQEYNYDIIFDSDLYYSNLDVEYETDKYFKVKVIDWNEQVIFEGTLKELLDFKECEE